MQLVPELDSSSRSSVTRSIARRAPTAAVCKDWAGVHDSDNRIWEAVSMDYMRAHALKKHSRESTALCLHR